MRETFEWSVWNFAPDSWVYGHHDTIEVVDAKVVGEQGDEQLCIELEMGKEE